MHSAARFDIVQQRLGLGCAGLGSVLGADRRKATHLVRTAYENGIRFFDTASVYGQGDSERILALALHKRRSSVTIATKAGQHFPAWMRFATPFKRSLAPWIRRSDIGRRYVSGVRDTALPQDFSDAYLRSSTEASLRRLNTDYIDILLLHSPPSDVIENGEALRSLEKLRASGKAVKIGVSCEDVSSGLLALDDERVEVIELPLWPATALTDRFLARAERQAVLVIGRGLLRATSQADREEGRPLVGSALAAALARREIGRLLIGTTRVAHLAEVLETIPSGDEVACI
jgi:aryl-alcohol dehydrogenase-like predicted oxidoreductase